MPLDEKRVGGRGSGDSGHYYVRIGFWNDSKTNPVGANCRMWIRGFGDFYPARQSDWRFGGTLIEKAGPFAKDKTQTLHLYPRYTSTDDGPEIKVPFQFSEGMSLKAPGDMITITFKPNSIEIGGTPIKNATGQAYFETRR